MSRGIIRRFGVSAAAVVLGLGGLFLTATPAAAQNYVNLCNSEYSVETIRVYSDLPSYNVYLTPGACTSFFNGYDNLRVDVEYCTGGCRDVNSYKIGEIGVGWGPCHEDSENSASNPPDSYNENGIRYRNYDTTRCS